MVTVPSVKLFTSLSVMVLPVALTEPLKSLAPPAVTVPPAVRLVGPVATVSVLLVPWVTLPVVAVRSKVLALTTPFTARLVAALALRLPAVVTVPSVSAFASTMVTLLPFRLTAPTKSLPALPKVIAAGCPPCVAVKLLVDCAVITLPLDWLMAPSVLVTLNVPVLVRLPNGTPAVVSVMLVFPPTETLPEAPWLKFWVTDRSPPRVMAPPVCTNEAAVMVPVPEKLPPLWLKLSEVVEPVLVRVPPLCVRPLNTMPPVPTFKVPALCDKLPPAPVNPSMLTAPLCAGATTVLPKLAVTPVGMTTLATLDKSGTAPPTQLAGSNQLPVVPPTQVTEFRRVMLLCVLLA